METDLKKKKKGSSVIAGVIISELTMQNEGTLNINPYL